MTTKQTLRVHIELVDKYRALLLSGPKTPELVRATGETYRAIHESAAALAAPDLEQLAPGCSHIRLADLYPIWQHKDDKGRDCPMVRLVDAVGVLEKMIRDVESKPALDATECPDATLPFDREYVLAYLECLLVEATGNVDPEVKKLLEWLE